MFSIFPESFAIVLFYFATYDYESYQVHVPAEKPSLDLALLDEYEVALRTDGVVVLRNLFTDEHLDRLTEEFDKNWEEVEKRSSSPLRTRV